MPKSLRLLAAALLFSLAALSALPAAANIPTCYSNLPKHSYPDPSWTYSHQCKEGSQIWYVYIDFRGRWHLTSSNILP